ncbi:protein wings apart-like isoform X2 [Cimex lectularius]|nr:protein wings apart-like isoform X2 [Cimex lectularius]
MNISPQKPREPSPLHIEPPHPLPSPEPQHPPIVLRIFKGTSQLLTENEVPCKKEGRRKSHSNESVESVSPKRHRSKSKDDEPPRKENLNPFDDTIMKEEVLQQAVVETVSDDITNSHVDFSDKINHIDNIEKQVCDDDRAKLLSVLEDHSQGPLSPEIKPEEPETETYDIKENEVKEEQYEVKNDNKVEWIADYRPISSPPLEKNLSKPFEDKVEPIVLRRPQAISKPSRKAGSIFKSRAASGEKRTAPRYIHNWSDQKDEGKTGQSSGKPQRSRIEGEFDSEVLTRVTNYSSGEKENEEFESITSVTCSKKAKKFYTVVRNVKKAHQIQESGEFQEFNDDVEYILDALQDNNPISTRCLSAITLASKCMVPAFRMHVRAHGTVTKFFRALHDATKDQRLGMCTATVMFVLSQDRLNMDVDRDSLELMLSLLESDASHSSALEGCGLSDIELIKTKERVRSLCQEIQEHGHAKHLNLENITVGQLAMETLLSLTSRRAGEWFKEELRDLGGLEHIIKTVVETCKPIDHDVTEWTPQLLDRLRKADRCLKVLENVTLQNEENSMYILTYGDGVLVNTIVKIFAICDQQLPYYPCSSSKDKESVGAIIRECLIASLKVLINLTHDFNNKSFGSSRVGQKEGILQASLHALLHLPQYVPDDQKFDITVLALILLINLVEHCEENRKLLMEATAPVDPEAMFLVEVSAVNALVKLFLQQEELARTEERKTDAILDGEKQEVTQQVQKSNEEFIEETVQLLLQKAGRHMEHTLIGAYIALLLGYLTIDNEEYEKFVRGYMPNQNYEMILSVLQKFYNFMTLTASSGSTSSRGIKATERLIKQLTEIDKAITGVDAKEKKE